MKIGLVRHFKVNTGDRSGLMTWEEYNKIMTEYDILDVSPTEVDLRGVDWNKCYASSLSRAIKTAETIYGGEILKFDEIREVDIRLNKPVKDRNDIIAWSLYSMFLWSSNSGGVEEGLEESRKRVRIFLDQLEEDAQEEDNILIVCHGMIMMVIDEELKKRGFSGDDLVFAHNGDLYLYER